jgi:hypothetical protein
VLLIAGGVAGAVVLTNLLDFELGGMRIRVLNANLASSWSHRATAATLLLGGGLAALRAGQAAPLRRWWSPTAAVLILLFVVEVSPAHVQVDRLSYGKLVYVPLLAALVICVVRLLDGSDQVTVMGVGLGALAASYAVHILGPAVVRLLGWGTDSWAYQVKVGLKEGMELSGWLLLVWALWHRRSRLAGREDGSRPPSDAVSVDPRPVVPRPPVRRCGEASPMGCRQTDQA